MLVSMKCKGPSFALEDNSGAPICCGIDEAGRAPLAGPVVAACVYIPPDTRTKKFWSKVRDSKLVPKEQRQELFTLITEHACYGIAQAPVEEIDDINIHHATLLAMKRAQIAMMEAFKIEPNMTLVDGKFIPAGLPCPANAVIGGDNRSRSIAAASILAKVSRDRLMTGLHENFPVYGWISNVGYPTPPHLRAIREHGITAHHRRSFAPCKQIAAL